MHLEVNVVWQEEKPGFRPLTRAEAEDVGHVIAAEGRVRHDHVMFRDRSVLDHLKNETGTYHHKFQHARRNENKYKDTKSG